MTRQRAEPLWASVLLAVHASVCGVGGMAMLPALLYHLTAVPGLL